MANRVVKVTLSAQVAEYKKGMLEAAQATRNVGTEGEKLQQTREALNTLGQAGVAAGGLLAAGVGVAIAKFAEFDQAMSYVQAATHESAGNMDLLRQAALEAGASTVFSATESANAIEELSKAGISTADILGGALSGALDLAAAGGLGVADAAGIAATTMQQFGLQGKDAAHVADLLAAGAGKAMGDVSDIAQALNQAGLVASQFGISVEETTGTLAAFAQAGLIGSDAGTSFRTMLLRLANPTEEVKTLMSDLNIQAYDQQGNFVGLSRLAGNLQNSLAGMTQAQKDQTLAMIFGQDAIRSANILLREGEMGIRRWTAAVDDQGYAAETAAMRLDNLLGDWEAFTGALDTAFIQMGQGADGPLRALVQGLTSLTEGFTQLPAWVQEGTLVLGGAIAVIGLVGGAALLAVPKIVEFRVALQTMGITAASTKGALSSAAGFLGGPWGAAITVAVAAAGVWIASQAKMAATAAELRDTLDETTGAITDYTTRLVAKKLQESGAFDAAREAGISQKELTDAVVAGGDALDEVSRKLSANNTFGTFFSGVGIRAGNASSAIRELRGSLDQAEQGHKNLQAATAGTAEAAVGTAGAIEGQINGLGGLSDAAGEAEDDVNRLAKAITDFGKQSFDVESATMAFESAVDDLDAALKDGKGSLDLTTEAGRTTGGALLDTARSTNEYAAAVAAMGGSTEQVQGILEAGRQKIIDTRRALGDSEEAARAYADRLIATPSVVQTEVRLQADEAIKRAQDVARAINNIPGYREVVINQMVRDTGADRGAVGAAYNANGGLYDYAFANGGGVDTGIYRGRPQGMYKFAEQETVWEAFISGKPDQRQRNVGIWQETGRRLGVEATSAAPSIVGAQITGSLDLGGGLVGVIDGRIVAAQEADARTAARGMVRR